MGDDDDRREAAMAAAPVLQPNFQANSVTGEQLLKLKELRRRRLQIKKSDSSFKKMKDTKGMAVRDKTTMVGEASVEKDTIQRHHPHGNVPGDSNLYVQNADIYTLCQEQKVPLTWKKRQKLHWGLDTKERWERKGNM